eukprot:gene15992-22126_t
MAESEVRQKVFNEVTKAIEGKQDLDAFYTDLQSAGPNDEVSAELIDVFWVLWLKLDGSSQKMKLVELMKDCIRDKKIDKKAAMETLEHDCMQAVGIIPDVDMWKKKEIRFSTKINYTQTKYNLLREDSEGYAKLVTALNQFGTACLVDDMVPMLAKEIQALIGYFDLDPNRCLDLVLEAAEQQPTNSATIKLIPMFKRDAVVHLLGFKFQQHQKPEADPVWPNLYNLAARLVQEGLVGLDELLGHLAPSDAAIKSAQEATKHALQKEVDNIGVISLVGGNGPQTEVKDFREHQELTRAAAAAAGSGNHQQRLEREAAMVAAQRAEQQKRIGISAAQLNLDPSTTFERLLLDPEAAHNQKLGLLQALAELNLDPSTTLEGLLLDPEAARYQNFGLLQALAELNLDPSTTLEGLLLDPEAARYQNFGLLQALAELNLDPSTTLEGLMLDPEAAHNQKLGLLQALAEVSHYQFVEACLFHSRKGWRNTVAVVAQLNLDPSITLEGMLLDPKAAHNQNFGLLQALA